MGALCSRRAQIREPAQNPAADLGEGAQQPIRGTAVFQVSTPTVQDPFWTFQFQGRAQEAQPENEPEPPTAQTGAVARQRFRRAVRQIIQVLRRRREWSTEGRRLQRWAPLFTHVTRVNGALRHTGLPQQGQRPRR
jgi:hypothetical protein